MYAPFRLARPSQHSAHGSVHRVGADPVQGFLAGIAHLADSTSGRAKRTIACMHSWNDRCAQAERHVFDGQRVIDRQRVLIARQKALGADTHQSEALLASFECSQAIFEDDLVRIRRQRP
jgi:hypothetical protein